MARRGGRGAARSLRAPAPRRDRRAGPGDVDPQQAPARGARSRGAEKAHGRAGGDRRRPAARARASARVLHDLRPEKKRGNPLMRIARFDDNLVGVVLDDGIHDVTAVLSELPPYRYPLPGHDVLIANLAKLSGKFEQAARRAPALEIEKLKLLSPVANPGKIMAAPVNYTKHLDEVLADKGIHHGNLISEIHKAGIFLKASSSVVGPGEGVRLVHLERRNDHEVELAVVIGKGGRNILAADALGFVAGYCIGLDMTIRGPEERSLRKSPDSYTVLGPWLVTADEIPNPGQLDLKIAVNGAVRQQ